jgi:hypothetical protein
MLIGLQMSSFPPVAARLQEPGALTPGFAGSDRTEKETIWKPDTGKLAPIKNPGSLQATDCPKPAKLRFSAMVQNRGTKTLRKDFIFI